LGFLFHPLEACRELSIRFFERDFGIEAGEARKIRRGEEEVADFFGEGGRGTRCGVSTTSALAAGVGLCVIVGCRRGRRRYLADFVNFLLEFFQNFFETSPVEADIGGATRQLMGFHQRRERARDAAEKRFLLGRVLPFPGFAAALFGFQLLPILEDLRRSLGLHVAENMRMPANHFRVNGFDDIADIELAGFGGDQGVKYNLKQEVAEFGCEFARIARIHGVENFVGLLEQKCAQRSMRLLAIPRATTGGAEPGLQCEEVFEEYAGSGPLVGRATARISPC